MHKVLNSHMLEQTPSKSSSVLKASHTHIQRGGKQFQPLDPGRFPHPFARVAFPILIAPLSLHLSLGCLTESVCSSL